MHTNKTSKKRARLKVTKRELKTHTKREKLLRYQTKTGTLSLKIRRHSTAAKEHRNYSQNTNFLCNSLMNILWWILIILRKCKLSESVGRMEV